MVRDLVLLKKWCDSNFLTLNINKTNILRFKCNFGSISLESITISNFQTNTFLGLYIDNKLKFDLHVTNLNRKLSQSCYAIRMVSRELSREVAVSVYHTLFESRVCYGLCFWGCCTESLFGSVFILQKRAIRIICKARQRDSCRPLFVSLGILTLTSLFILETVCLVREKYKLEISQPSAYATRHCDFKLRPIIPSSDLIKKSIIYNGKKLFNHLILHIRKIESKRQFRTATKNILIGKAYYSVDEFFSDLAPPQT